MKTNTIRMAVVAGILVALGSSAQASDAGKKTYDSSCMACHATGAAGAPKLGDKAAWAPRIAAGKEKMPCRRRVPVPPVRMPISRLQWVTWSRNRNSPDI